MGFTYLRSGDHPERAPVFRERIGLPGARWQMIAFAPTDDPALAPFTAAFDLMGDGSMMVLPTPGHLLVGDLTYDEQLLERDQVTAVCDDPEQLLASYAKVRALKGHSPALIVLPAHDLDAAHQLGTTSQQHT